MLRSVAYKLAKYTSWIIIALGLILPLLFGALEGGDMEGIIFIYLFLMLPFLILPSVLFLVVLLATKKWKKTFKPLLILGIVILASFIIYGFYLVLQGSLSLNFMPELFILGIFVVIIIESILLLTSKN